MATIDIGPEVDYLPNGQRRCTANKSDGSDRCKAPAMQGGKVCRSHGGSAPQVKRKARLRLAELVDPAIGKLARIMAQGDDRVALRAVENVLDRAGYPRTANIEVEDARALLRERLDKLREEAREHPDRFRDVVDAEIVEDDDE